MALERPKYFVGTDVDGILGRAEQLFVRGENLNDLLGRATFTDALYHILLGRLPSAKQRALLDLVLVAFHGGLGLLPPTTLVPRLVAGTGVPVAHALAAGYLASGPYHVGAVEDAMRMYAKIYDAFQARQTTDATAGDLEHFAADWVGDLIRRGETVAGYGHPLFRKDPRPTHIRRVLCDMEVASPYLDIYDGVVRGTAAHKPVAPNVDGITAAILLTLGCNAEHGTGLFLLARTAAMLAHVIEERTEMPYQTQKRFMILPILAPRLFNANFQWWTKFFNRLRDNQSFQRLLALFAGNAKKPFRARAEEDRQVIASARQRRAEQPPCEQGLVEGSSQQVEPFASLEEFLSNGETQALADWIAEPLAGAAVCLATTLHQLDATQEQPGGDDARAAQQQVKKLVGEALRLVQQAAETAKS